MARTKLRPRRRNLALGLPPSPSAGSACCRAWQPPRRRQCRRTAERGDRASLRLTLLLVPRLARRSGTCVSAPARGRTRSRLDRPPNPLRAFRARAASPSCHFAPSATLFTACGDAHPVELIQMMEQKVHGARSITAANPAHPAQGSRRAWGDDRGARCRRPGRAGAALPRPSRPLARRLYRRSRAAAGPRSGAIGWFDLGNRRRETSRRQGARCPDAIRAAPLA